MFSIKREIKVNPQKDLVPLCSNCHKIDSSKYKKPLTIKELTKIVIIIANNLIFYKLSFNPLNLLGGFLYLCFQMCDILCLLKYRVSIDRVIEYEIH